jgi:hypothetical protein
LSRFHSAAPLTSLKQLTVEQFTPQAELDGLYRTGNTEVSIHGCGSVMSGGDGHR